MFKIRSAYRKIDPFTRFRLFFFYETITENRIIALFTQKAYDGAVQQEHFGLNQENGGKKMEHTIESNRLVSKTYTAEQVAAILGVSVRKVYLLCEATKDFKVIRMGKRCLRIHKESFDKWFDNMCGIQ